MGNSAATTQRQRVSSQKMQYSNIFASEGKAPTRSPGLLSFVGAPVWAAELSSEGHRVPETDRNRLIAAIADPVIRHAKIERPAILGDERTTEP
jgi:hypothetical protein